MCWALALIVSTGLAGPQAVAELEWTRSAPLGLVTQLPEADAEQRARIARALGRTRDPRAIEPLAASAHDLLDTGFYGLDTIAQHALV